MDYIEYMDNKIKVEKEAIAKVNVRAIFNNIIVEEKINIPEDEKYNYEYVARKQRDTYIILIDKVSGIKIYLSDYEIIECLVFFLENDSYFFEIYKVIMQFLENKGIEYKYSIGDDYKFDAIGIECLKSDISYLLKSDTKINLNELIMLINLVIIKELKAKDKNKAKATVLKYILFSLLFCNNSSINKEEVKRLLSKVIKYKTDSLKSNYSIINGKNIIDIEKIELKEYNFIN